MTLETALLAALSILAGIVAYFFKILFASAAECKEDRQKLSNGILEIREQMAVFKACPSDPCPARQGLERSSETFSLKAVKQNPIIPIPKPKP